MTVSNILTDRYSGRMVVAANNRHRMQQGVSGIIPGASRRNVDVRHPRNLRAAPAIVSGSAPAIIADLRLRVVTPMFGGGVDAGINDPNHLIRPSAIRGQLRFWWRACNASHFPTLGDLHKAERALWGSAAKKNDPSHGPGALQLVVTEISGGSKVYFNKKMNDNDGDNRWYVHEQRQPRSLSYCLFPFELQNDPNEQALTGTIGATFRLQLRVAPHVRNENDRQFAQEAAHHALWTWIMFGGVGARTRRGCGTLLVQGEGNKPNTKVSEHQLPAAVFRVKSQAPARYLAEGLETCLGTGALFETPVPSLGGYKLFSGTGTGGPVVAWAQAIESLQQFLQGPGIGRSEGSGGSYWPEARAARAIDTDQNYSPFPKFPIEEATGKQFPRADLGLPRVMKLSPLVDRTVTVKRSEPDFGRMASPIILKALPISETQAVPIILILTAPHIWDADSPDLIVTTKENNEERILATLSPTPLNDSGEVPGWQIRKPPHVDDRGIESVRDAFYRFLDGKRIKGERIWNPVP